MPLATPAALFRSVLDTAISAYAMRPRLDLRPGAWNHYPEENRHDILVATSRKWTDDGVEHVRSPDLSFGAFTVGLPAGHQAGRIEWSNRPGMATETFAFLGQERHHDADEFECALGEDLEASSGDVFLYIHGYNVTFPTALFRATQIVHDYEVAATPVVYSWPSAGRMDGYMHDRDSALFARRGLVELIDMLEHSCARRIVVVSHSLGSQLFMDAMRDRALRDGAPWRKLDAVILVAPDIDVEVFRMQVSEIGTLPDPFVIVSSGRDRVIRLSSILNRSSRLGYLTDVSVLSDLPVILVDTSEITAAGVVEHYTVATSSALIDLFRHVSRNGTLMADRAEMLKKLSSSITKKDQALGLVLDGSR